MRHLINIIIFAIFPIVLVSCLSDAATSSSPKCCITSFAIDDITTTLTTTGSDGEDSTYTRTLDGDLVYFNIDQLNGTITSTDSLLDWIDLTKVVPTIGYTGYLYVCPTGDSIYYSCTSGSDSIDFTSPVKFLVVATDGISYREYTAQILRRSSTADSLYWEQLQDSSLTISNTNCQCSAIEELAITIHQSQITIPHAHYPSKTNSEIENIVALDSLSYSDHIAIWRKISSTNVSLDQAWQEIQITDDNSYALPYLSEPQIVYYNSALYVIGKSSSFYRSDDGGITWREQSSLFMPPAELTGSFTIFADNDYLYIIDNNNNIYRGIVQ